MKINSNSLIKNIAKTGLTNMGAALKPLDAKRTGDVFLKSIEEKTPDESERIIAFCTRQGTAKMDNFSCDVAVRAQKMALKNSGYRS